MSIADHFDNRSDAGFIRAYDAHAARRQFQISVMLVVVLGIAALALAVLARPGWADSFGRSSAAIASGPKVAQTLLDMRG